MVQKIRVSCTNGVPFLNVIFLCVFTGLVPLGSQEPSDSLAVEIVTPEIR